MSGGAVTGKFRNKTSINGKHWLDFPVVHTSMTWHNMTWHDMVLTWHDWTLHCLTLCQVTFALYIKGDPHKLPYGTLTITAPKKILHTSCYKYNNKLYTYKHTLCRHTHTLHPNLRYFHEIFPGNAELWQHLLIGTHRWPDLPGSRR